MQDLDEAGLGDIGEFFKTYYAPNNAILTLAGDIDPDDALARVKKFFGMIPAQPRPEQPFLGEDERIGERRTVVYDPLARLPKLMISWQIPPGNTPDNDAIHMLAQVLDGGKSARFYQTLVKDKELATEEDLSPDMRIGPSLLYAMATPRPGVKPEELEAAIVAILDDVAQKGVTEGELAKARRQVRRQTIERRQTSLSTAMWIGELAVRFGDPELFNTRYDKLLAVTAAQIREAAKKFIQTHRRTVVLTLPKETKS
ncbi:MAG: insulinase family protein [Elusimicrobia bacterium]|nr:insulinase family protein [Elusimicrobiota bacterium]